MRLSPHLLVLGVALAMTTWAVLATHPLEYESRGSCGYDVSWRVVNARHWLPQFRERV